MVRLTAVRSGSEEKNNMTQSKEPKMTTEKTTTEKTSVGRPVFTARLRDVRVSVWLNERPDGQSWYSTTIVRRYRDGDDFRETNSLNGLADLALMAEAVRLARDYIAMQERHEAETHADAFE
jgi:hypothetical protein